MTLVTLVAGSGPDMRESAIAERMTKLMHSDATTALILEGMPIDALNFDPSVQVVRLAPGCPCCTGNLVMRVTLNRILRKPPSQLFISIANEAHIDNLRNFLTQSPYDTLITLDDDLLI